MSQFVWPPVGLFWAPDGAQVATEAAKTAPRILRFQFHIHADLDDVKTSIRGLLLLLLLFSFSLPVVVIFGPQLVQLVMFGL